MARKVLIIRLGAMGDVCMAVPVVAALQRHCDVHWLVRQAYADIPRLFPDVRCRLIAVPARERFASAVIAGLRSERYDAVLDFTHWPLVAELVREMQDVPIRGITHDPHQDQLLRVQPHGVDLAGPFNRIVPVQPNQHQVDKWRRLLGDALGLDVPLHWPLPERRQPGERLRLFLHPHASKANKRWPGHRFAEVLTTLARSRPIECVINSGSKKELPTALGVWLRLRLAGIRAHILWLDRGYQRLRAALQHTDLALGCDSGPMHLAALFGVPTVVIYGPYTPTEFGPLWRSTAVSPPQAGQSARHVSAARVVSAALAAVQHTSPLRRRA